MIPFATIDAAVEYLRFLLCKGSMGIITADGQHWEIEPWKHGGVHRVRRVELGRRAAA